MQKALQMSARVLNFALESHNALEYLTILTDNSQLSIFHELALTRWFISSRSHLQSGITFTRALRRASA
jgi:hypothetical protein